MFALLHLLPFSHPDHFQVEVKCTRRWEHGTGREIISVSTCYYAPYTNWPTAPAGMFLLLSTVVPAGRQA